MLLEIAREAGLDVDRLRWDLEREQPRSAILEDARLGQERYRVRGTPTLMLGDGTKLRHPIAYPRMQGASVVGVSSLPCHGDECIAATRDFFERALQPPVGDPTER